LNLLAHGQTITIFWTGGEPPPPPRGGVRVGPPLFLPPGFPHPRFGRVFFFFELFFLFHPPTSPCGAGSPPPFGVVTPPAPPPPLFRISGCRMFFLFLPLDSDPTPFPSHAWDAAAFHFVYSGPGCGLKPQFPHKKRLFVDIFNVPAPPIRILQWLRRFFSNPNRRGPRPPSSPPPQQPSGATRLFGSFFFPSAQDPDFGLPPPPPPHPGFFNFPFSLPPPPSDSPPQTLFGFFEGRSMLTHPRLFFFFVPPFPTPHTIFWWGR